MASTPRHQDWRDFVGQGRVIVIHASILEWAGDYHAAALFEELVWRWNTYGEEPFVAKDDELMAKLFMTRGALRGARARLVELGSLGTVRGGTPPVLRYTVHPYAAGGAPLLAESASLIGGIRIVDGAIPAQRLAETASTSISSECIQSKDQGAASRSAAKRRAPAELGPGSEVYKDVIHLTPNHQQRVMLDAAHERHGEPHMRVVMVDWLGRGWSPKNVAGMIDAMDNGLSGGGGRRNGRPEIDLSQVLT